MADIQSTLASIATLPQRDKTTAYLSLIDPILSTQPSPLPTLNLFLESVLSDSLAQVVARTVLAEFVSKVQQVPDTDARKELLKVSVNKMQPRVTSFEEQVCTLREHYAQLLENDEEFSQAAQVLIGIPLESGSRTNDYKLKVYIRIVRLFLEEEDSTSADTYFNRASLLYHTTQDLETQLMFKLSQARMFDYSRKFGEAAPKYHELSYVGVLDPDERLNCLTSAIQCAVLAPAGPTRSRILASLYRDERSSQTDHYPILSKTFLSHIIRPSEITTFASTLKTHQLALLSSSSSNLIPSGVSDHEMDAPGKKGPQTVLDRAMMEHNVLASSRIYKNITFKGLGLLLDLHPSAAEAMARTMVQQGRLRASLDQLEGEGGGLVTFDSELKEGDGVVSNVAAMGGLGGEGEEEEERGEAEATKRWDEGIRLTLQAVEGVAGRCEQLLSRPLEAAQLPTVAAS